MNRSGCPLVVVHKETFVASGVMDAAVLIRLNGKLTAVINPNANHFLYVLCSSTLKSRPSQRCGHSGSAPSLLAQPKSQQRRSNLSVGTKKLCLTWSA